MTDEIEAADEMPPAPPMPNEPMNTIALEFESGGKKCELRWECLRAAVGEIDSVFPGHTEELSMVAASAACLTIVASMQNDGWLFVPPKVAPNINIDLAA